MGYDKYISEQVRVGRDLARDRQELLEALPFGAELEPPQHDLSQVTTPVVAIAGASSVGKSYLINRLAGADVLPVGATPTTMVPVLLRSGEKNACQAMGPQGPRPIPFGDLAEVISSTDPNIQYVMVESSAIQDCPWQWLDVPGTNSQRGKQNKLPFRPADLASLCVFATSALQPLSLADVNQLLQLSSMFPDERLCIAVTRWDQIREADMPSVRSYLQEILTTALPKRSLRVFETSESDLATIQQFLATSIYELQRERLKAADRAWRAMLSDIHALLKLSGLTELKPETIERIRARLDRSIIEAGLELREAVSPLLESLLRQQAPSLPVSQRALTEIFQSSFQNHFEPKLSAIQRRLNAILHEELEKDLTKKTTVTLINRFGTLLPGAGVFFDWRAAATAGAVGGGAAAAALGAALITGPVGWVLAGGALLGGLMGGFLGTASTIDSAAELREKVGQPIATHYHQQIEEKVGETRWDLQHFCRLLHQVLKIFAGPNGVSIQQEEVEQLLQLVKTAEVKARQISGEIRRIENEREMEDLRGAETEAKPETAIQKVVKAPRR